MGNWQINNRNREIYLYDPKKNISFLYGSFFLTFFYGSQMNFHSFCFLSVYGPLQSSKKLDEFSMKTKQT